MGSKISKKDERATLKLDADIYNELKEYCHDEGLVIGAFAGKQLKKILNNLKQIKRIN